MELFIEGLTGTIFELKVSPFETIKSIKTKIQRTEGIPIGQQHLIWQNNELEDERSLRDYDITCGSTLRLVLGMRGGPINTRRVLLSSPSPVFSNCSTPSLRSACTSPQPSTGSGILNDGSDHISSNTHITLLVFKEGDHINLFRVIDKNDPTLSPLVEAVPGSPSLSDGNNDDYLIRSEEDGTITHYNSSDEEVEMKGKNFTNIFEDHPLWLPDWLRFLPQPPLGPRKYPIKFTNLCKAPNASDRLTNSSIPKLIKNESINEEDKMFRDKCTNLQSKLEQLKLNKQFRHNKVSYVDSRSSSRQFLRNGKLNPLTNNLNVPDTIFPVITSPSNMEHKQLEFPPLFPNSECNLGLRFNSRNTTKSFNPHLNKPSEVFPQINCENNIRISDNSKRTLVSGFCGRSSSLGPSINKVEVEDISDSVKPKKCFLCNKKTGLATSYECRCGYTFCSIHRYAETHQCTYDYKSNGRRWLQESNPMISASKLPKI